MTREQFEVVADLIGSRRASREAARLVLVDGLGQPDAMRATGLSRPGVWQAVERVRRAWERIDRAWCARTP